LAYYGNNVRTVRNLRKNPIRAQLFSSGLGLELSLAALKRGDKVIATGRPRSMEKLAELKAKGADILQLDVTAPLETLQDVAKEAVRIYGRIDVLVNNAGTLR